MVFFNNSPDDFLSIKRSLSKINICTEIIRILNGSPLVLKWINLPSSSLVWWVFVQGHWAPELQAFSSSQCLPQLEPLPQSCLHSEAACLSSYICLLFFRNTIDGNKQTFAFLQFILN